MEELEHLMVDYVSLCVYSAMCHSLNARDPAVGMPVEMGTHISEDDVWRGKSRCISSVSLSDQGVEIWGKSAASSASRSGSSGAPERVQSHSGTRRVTSSIQNLPVWGMLNRLAE